MDHIFSYILVSGGRESCPPPTPVTQQRAPIAYYRLIKEPAGLLRRGVRLLLCLGSETDFANLETTNKEEKNGYIGRGEMVLCLFTKIVEGQKITCATATHLPLVHEFLLLGRPAGVVVRGGLDGHLPAAVPRPLPLVRGQGPPLRARMGNVNQPPPPLRIGKYDLLCVRLQTDERGLSLQGAGGRSLDDGRSLGLF